MYLLKLSFLYDLSNVYIFSQWAKFTKKVFYRQFLNVYRLNLSLCRCNKNVYKWVYILQILSNLIYPNNLFLSMMFIVHNYCMISLFTNRDNFIIYRKLWIPHKMDIFTTLYCKTFQFQKPFSYMSANGGAFTLF